jgi:hypothetical protein
MLIPNSGSRKNLLNIRRYKLAQLTFEFGWVDVGKRLAQRVCQPCLPRGD